MKTNFADKQTFTMNKQCTEEYSDALFQPILKELIKKTPNASCAILIGQAKAGGLLRHYNRMRALGFAGKNIYGFENNRLTYLAQLRELRRLKLPMKLIFCQNIYDELEKHKELGRNWLYVEGDGTGSFGCYDFGAISTFKKLKIATWLIVGAARGRSPLYDIELKRGKYKRTYNSHGQLRFELNRIAPQIIKRKLQGKFWFDFFTYAGITNMYQIVGIDKRFL